MKMSVMVLLMMALVGSVGCVDMKDALNRPEIEIVSVTGDDLSSGLGEYSARAAVVVRNDGGRGRVKVTCTFYQGGNRYPKSRTFNMSANHTETIWFQCDEVTMFGGEVSLIAGGEY